MEENNDIINHKDFYVGEKVEENESEKVDELVRKLELHVAYMKENNDEMSDVSWGMEEGVLISGDEAELIVKFIKGL